MRGCTCRSPIQIKNGSSTFAGLLGRIASACSALTPLRALAAASSASSRRSSSCCCCEGGGVPPSCACTTLLCRRAAAAGQHMARCETCTRPPRGGTAGSVPPALDTPKRTPAIGSSAWRRARGAGQLKAGEGLAAEVERESMSAVFQKRSQRHGRDECARSDVQLATDWHS